VCMMLDFNRTPYVSMLLGQYDGRRDHFTVAHELCETRSVHAAIAAFEKWVKAAGGFKWPELWLYGDASGGTPTTQDEQSHYDLIATVLRRNGVRFRLRVPKSNPSIISRLLAFNDALLDSTGERHVSVHPRCKYLVTDLQESTLDEDEKPNENNKLLGHCGAAVGYWIHYTRPVGGRRERKPGRFALAEAR
jgi:hypothetical protein